MSSHASSRHHEPSRRRERSTIPHRRFSRGSHRFRWAVVTGVSDSGLTEQIVVRDAGKARVARSPFESSRLLSVGSRDQATSQAQCLQKASAQLLIAARTTVAPVSYPRRYRPDGRISPLFGMDAQGAALSVVFWPKPHRIDQGVNDEEIAVAGPSWAVMTGAPGPERLG
jgi:hypothetical protein